MPFNGSPSDRLTDIVHSRIHQRVALRAGLWSVAAGSLAILLLAVFYFWQGFPLPHKWYLVAACVTVVAALVMAVRGGISRGEAAKFTDHFFGLQDALASHLAFQQAGRQDGFYGLQRDDANRRAAQVDPARIDIRPPRWLTAVATALLLLAVAAGFKGPSQAVRRQWAEEAFTQQRSQETIKQLTELVDKLQENAEDTAERELLQPEKLREWLRELSPTKDPAEAMRQLARLEQKLRDASWQLDRRYSEELWQRAARELERARIAPELARDLKAKDYQRAKQQVERLQPDRQLSLDKQRQSAERLKAVSQRLSAAAKSRIAKPQRAKNQIGQDIDAESLAATANLDPDQASELAQDLQNLDDAATDWHDAAEKACENCDTNGQCDTGLLLECQECQSRAGQQLAKVQLQLQQLALMRRAQGRLAALCRKCSQCQSNRLSENGTPVEGQQLGGREAGTATDPTRRDERSPLANSGPTAQLHGIQGAGPSQSIVQQADYGSGRATRSSVAREREFRQQVESYVMREDVPSDVRDGVKHYFEAIHEHDQRD